jgi:hypothetical protein
MKDAGTERRGDTEKGCGKWITVFSPRLRVAGSFFILHPSSFIAWGSWQDLNPQPRRSKRRALSFELQERSPGGRCSVQEQDLDQHTVPAPACCSCLLVFGRDGQS